VDQLFPISRREFRSRLETVKELEQTDFETYRIVKDRETGQHYLQYTFVHINLSEAPFGDLGVASQGSSSAQNRHDEGGRRDEHEHFLPLESDDVLGFLFGEQPYRFPENWRRPYLRSGTDDRLMPFDPSENHDLEKEAETERALLDKLIKYKQEWQSAGDKEQLTKKLFDDLDDLMKKPNDD
jgi:hypothetical protein